MSYLTDDISMAAVNEAKVVNIDESVKEAQNLLNNHLIDSGHVATINDALKRIKEMEDYEVQPEMVNEIDSKINDVGNLVVSRGGDVSLVSGTESFGLTLSPKEWRRTRIAGCENLLEELGKSIKNYANKLAEKLSEIFTGNKYAIASLEERLEEADKKLMFIETLRDDTEFVIIPEMLNKTLQAGMNRYIATDLNVDKIIGSEINFVGMAIKSWAEESVRYKNKLIRFFGNKGRGELRDLIRVHPKFMAKKLYIDEDNSSHVTWSTPNRFLGMAIMTFTEVDGMPDDLPQLVGWQAFTGYNLVTEQNSGKPIPELKVKPLSIPQLENLRKTIATCIGLMKLISEENNDFDTDSRDIKDILNSLKAAGDPVLMDSFSGMISQYQVNTTSTQGKIIQYLAQVVSHLITYMFIHMEGYDDA